MSTLPDFQALAPAGMDLPDFVADPYPLYAHLRELGPVHRVPTEGAGDVWVILGYEAARAALTNPALSTDVRYSSRWTSDGGQAVGRNMLQTDPPQHTRLRALVAGEFTARRIEALRPRIQQLTDELLDRIAPLGATDLVASLALPLPIAVICELLGVPEADREPFREWSQRIVFEPASPEGAAAAAAMAAFLADLLRSKEHSPGEDLLSALVRAEDTEGQRLPADELIGMAFLLLVAGHETTVNLLANGTYALLTHPEQLAALRSEPSLMEGAIEEMLRYEGPVTSAAYRWTTHTIEIAGRTIPAGEPVLIMLGSGSRDPGRFAGPDRFDIRRPRTPGGHLAFGHGIHHCLGAPLARLEAAVAFPALLDRLPGLNLDTDPAKAPWRPGLIRGLSRLPVRYTPTRPTR
ncbi:cytochrome P450 family protein [Streptomyces hiroshimensis]|uniref:Cytochrome P450 n=1 Tax=Streptomyces hiroshimensis TaxID=66424 RepID=A0ABQ2YBJ9_9ACTN|nr:cytochrome P450 [Streptomyces hiroshimensis]GGX76185.1 cytochrome P450 [Streptomyces hiroshimensis]